jgi:hypothetical protein
MVAIAACAHALDALYGELAEVTAPGTLSNWEKTRRGGRWAEVAGVLELAFEVDIAAWRPRLRTLFKLRNNAVHPKLRFDAPQTHPGVPVGVAAEHILFSAESATESVDLLLEILTTGVGAPKLGGAELWAHDAAGPIARLAKLRSEPGR